MARGSLPPPPTTMAYNNHSRHVTSDANHQNGHSASVGHLPSPPRAYHATTTLPSRAELPTPFSGSSSSSCSRNSNQDHLLSPPPLVYRLPSIEGNEDSCINSSSSSHGNMYQMQRPRIEPVRISKGTSILPGFTPQKAPCPDINTDGHSDRYSDSCNLDQERDILIDATGSPRKKKASFSNSTATRLKPKKKTVACCPTAAVKVIQEALDAWGGGRVFLFTSLNSNIGEWYAVVYFSIL